MYRQFATTDDVRRAVGDLSNGLGRQIKGVQEAAAQGSERFRQVQVLLEKNTQKQAQMEKGLLQMVEERHRAIQGELRSGLQEADARASDKSSQIVDMLNKQDQTSQSERQRIEDGGKVLVNQLAGELPPQGVDAHCRAALCSDRVVLSAPGVRRRGQRPDARHRVQEHPWCGHPHHMDCPSTGWP